MELKTFYLKGLIMKKLYALLLVSLLANGLKASEEVVVTGEEVVTPPLEIVTPPVVEEVKPETPAPDEVVTTLEAEEVKPVVEEIMPAPEEPAQEETAE